LRRKFCWKNGQTTYNCVWPKMVHAKDKRRTYVNKERKRAPKYYTRRGISQAVGKQITWFL